ncbi:hypothetical protein AbraIFM66950_008275, partial [Aspergillus brasiliensis]
KEGSGAGLIGKYVGHTEPRIREAIDSAKGNVLIIDDAYALWGGGSNSHSFHQAAIDTLCVLLVGYKDEVKEMFRKANPGLSSRFSLESAFRFEGYSPAQLERIMDIRMQEIEVSCSIEAKGCWQNLNGKANGRYILSYGSSRYAEVIECSVTDLVGEYVGHTGPKVLKLFNRALGKVLFIDEAYRLVDGNQFSKEAIGEIVGAMTNPRFEQKMFIILAGPMKSLRTAHDIRQFDRGFLGTSEIGTPKYETPQELCGLFTPLSKIDGWGNARDVHTISEDIVRKALLGPSDPDEPLSVTPGVVHEAIRRMSQRRGARPPFAMTSYL